MLSLLISFLLIGSTYSCSCVQRPPLSTDFAQTPTIFIGRVISKVPPASSFGSYEFTVEVEETFKGTTTGAHITVRTWEQGAMCGIGAVSVGSRLQLWLSSNGVTSLCTRTTSNILADYEELKQLAANSR